jgi:hypothetical protein
MAMTLLQSIAGIVAPGLSDVQEQATEAQQQLTLAFQVLIAEGAICILILAAIFFVASRK